MLKIFLPRSLIIFVVNSQVSSLKKWRTNNSFRLNPLAKVTKNFLHLNCKLLYDSYNIFVMRIPRKLFFHLYNSQVYRRIVLGVILSLLGVSIAHASYIPFNTTAAGNIGVGTSTPQGKFVVIGGNVGIGSLAPVQLLDVAGTVRASSFIGSGSLLTNLPANTPQWTLTNTNDVYETNGGNVGIGTTFTNAGAALSVMNGNVGIGTWAPVGKLIVLGGNVGIGSSNPGQVLDVTGTIRTSNFTMSGQVPMQGYVLTAADGQGDATWSAAGGISGWTITNTNDVYITLQGNVGIGTTYTNAGAALSIMNGNVGIGTWAPVGKLIVLGGNVGIGSATPGQALDVSGTVRATGFVGNGSLLTNIVGLTQWTTSNTNDVYLPNHGNVGIGTSFTNTGAALTVMNGNVGIGTWAPRGSLDVEGTLSVATFGGNVGIGTWASVNPFEIDNGGQSVLIAYPGGNGVYINKVLSSLYQSGGGYTFFTNTGATRAVDILGNGNVGIGSTIPGQVLDVIGSVRATAFIGNGAQLTGLTSSQWTTTNANDVYLPSSGNVGIGTFFTNSGAALSVMNGNVGIGTWAPVGKLIVLGGNVGIGSATPGQALDVSGTVRATGFVGNGSLLTNIVGLTQWTTSNTNDVYLPNHGNVGIGTSFTNTGAALTVMNGNVGIGTWVPRGGLDVEGSSTLAIFAGNVGISSTIPGQALDVQGTIRTTNFTMSGQVPMQGYVLTASDSHGDATWSAAGGVGGWTITNTNDVYETLQGNVGIGTTYTNAGAALSIINGNVGIGTWVPHGQLDVEGTQSISLFGGNVGIGTTITGFAALSVMKGNVGIGTWKPGDKMNNAYGGNGLPGGDIALLDVGNGSNDVQIDSNANILMGQGALNLFSNGGQAQIGAYYGIQFNSNNQDPRGYFFDFEQTVSTPVDLMRIDLNGNVGIGTTIPQGGLIVMNGNVGIGTWKPSRILEVEASSSGTSLTSASVAAVGIHNLDTTTNNFADLTFSTLDTSGVSKLGSKISGVFTSHTSGAVSGDMAFTTMNANTASEKMRITAAGNVGIGSTVPGQALDVNGTIRTTNFTMSGQVPVQGYVLTASDSKGDATWSAAGGVGGWTITNTNDVYETLNGNVGIGTTYTSAGAALSVMNGNVGIGTWAPVGKLVVLGGNVGIGSSVPGQVLDVNGTVRATAFVGNGALLTNIVGLSQWTTSNTNDVYLPNHGNVGIGTSFTNTGAALTVMNGNVGIGTWVPRGQLDVEGTLSTALFGGNVGIGSTNPTYALDVGGSFAVLNHLVNFTTPYSNTEMVFTPQSTHQSAEIGLNDDANQGWVLASNGSSNTIGSGVFIILDPSNTKAPIAINANDQVMIGGTNSSLMSSQRVSSTAAFQVLGTSDFNGNVGIGTSFTNTGTALQVMSGNMGIGTWRASGVLDVEGSLYPTIFYGRGTVENVGIGSLTPGQALDVNGSVRATAFIGNGSQLTGLTSSQWTTSNTNDVYLPSSGNVGIGTSFTNTGAALTVMNGNVGIGTWVPRGSLDIEGTLSVATFGGNVGIGSSNPRQAIDLVGNQVISGNLGIGSYPLAIGTPLGIAESQLSGNLAAIQNSTFFNPSSTVLLNVAETQTLNTSQTVSNNTIQFTKVDAGNGGTQNFSGTLFDLVSSDLELSGTVNILGPVAKIQDTNCASGTCTSTNDVMDLEEDYASNSGAVLNISEAGTGLGLRINGGGTYTSSTPFIVDSSANVGIGTFAAKAKLIVASGNVGIDSLTPGQALDVTGTVRAIAFIGNGSQLTGLSSSQWTTSNTNDVYLPASGNVGIGTSFTNTGAALTVMNGNVGIGTWKPRGQLDVEGTQSISVFGVNVGIGTWVPDQALSVNGELDFPTDNTYTIGNPTSGRPSAIYAAVGVATQTFSASNNVQIGSSYVNDPAYANTLIVQGNVGIGTPSVFSGGLIVWPLNTGNVGIGTAYPSQALDVAGTVRATAFIGNGSQLTGLSSSQWTTSNTNDVYLPNHGNVGIGTSFTNTGAALAVINGNVGIGTWVPRGQLDVEGTLSTTILNGNVGIGTSMTSTSALSVMNGNVGIGTWIPSANFNVVGTVSMTPSSAVSVSAGTSIAVTRTIVRIIGNGGAVTVTANPAIAAGQDGQEVIVIGTDSTDTVTLTNGNGLQLAGGVSFTFNKGSTMSLIYDAVNSKWVEISRSAN